MIFPRLIKKALLLKEERGWDHIAIAVDLHGTVFKSTYAPGLATEYYPHAKECLQELTKRPEILMYMYTGTPEALRYKYESVFFQHNIDIDVDAGAIMKKMNIKNNEFQNFNDKPYFNVLLEDKAGFDPMMDWLDILIYLKTGI